MDPNFHFMWHIFIVNLQWEKYWRYRRVNHKEKVKICFTLLIGGPSKLNSKILKNLSKCKYLKARDVVMLKGRHPCECQASRHTLVNNCTECGKIVCAQEGNNNILKISKFYFWLQFSKVTKWICKKRKTWKNKHKRKKIMPF